MQRSQRVLPTDLPRLAERDSHECYEVGARHSTGSDGKSKGVCSPFGAVARSRRQEIIFVFLHDLLPQRRNPA
jgi:hypothetical protein